MAGLRCQAERGGMWLDGGGGKETDDVAPFELGIPDLGHRGDKGRFVLYLKLHDFTLLFMILQVELRLNKDH